MSIYNVLIKNPKYFQRLFIKRGSQYAFAAFYGVFLTLLNSVVLFQSLLGEHQSPTARKDRSPRIQRFLNIKHSSQITSSKPTTQGTQVSQPSLTFPFPRSAAYRLFSLAECEDK